MWLSSSSISSCRFCVGDRFFLCDNKILCEYDYEERMVFANLAYNSNNLAQMKNQATRATALPPPPLGSMAGPSGKVRIIYLTFKTGFSDSFVRGEVDLSN